MDYYRFRLVADGPSGRTIDVVELWAGCPITVVVPPASLTLPVGDFASFSVSGPTYTTLSPIDVGSAGAYVCEIRTECGWTLAPPGTLTVSEPVPPSVGNTLQVTRSGATIEFRWATVGASGYRLYGSPLPDAASGTPLADAASPPLSLPAPPEPLDFFHVAAVEGCSVGPR